MNHLILTITLLFSSTLCIQSQTATTKPEGINLTVSVVNVLSDKGTVGFALFDKENFMKAPIQAKIGTIKNGKSTVVFKNIPKGVYAIISYHDENNNKRMDFFENGMPKESYGTSNNVINFGPPDFETSKFVVADKDLTLEIKF
ncbi:DUF2141 domain-containing protein [Lutibacter sp.]